MKPPATLFRYRSLAGDEFRHTQDIFLRKRLYAPHWKQLNDPTEGVYRPKKQLIYRAPHYYSVKVPLLQAAAETRVRVLSFSEDHRNPLLWSHYADSHRGICIGFRTDVLEKQATLRPVRYRKRVPTLSEEISEERKLAAGFLSKSEDWRYEHEWRIIHEREYLELPGQAIKAVVFGVRTSSDDKEWVLQWLRISGYEAATKRFSFSGHAAKMHVENDNTGT